MLWYVKLENCKRVLPFSHVFTKCNIPPVKHVATRTRRCLKQLTLCMEKFLHGLLLSRCAGFKASWKTAGGAWGEQWSSFSLPLLDGAIAAIQSWPPSWPGHRDISTGSLKIHVSHRLTRLSLLLVNPFQWSFICPYVSTKTHWSSETTGIWICFCWRASVTPLGSPDIISIGASNKADMCSHKVQPV